MTIVSAQQEWEHLAGALDPRGGMEAALVLKENSQQPWKAAEERNQVTRTETLNVTQAVRLAAWDES